MLLRLLIPLLCVSAAHAQVVRQFRVEYRKQPSGVFTSFLVNHYKAAVTAYIAQSTFRLEGKQQPNAWGGDAFSFPAGGTEVAPGQETESNSLPSGATPLTMGIVAVIYADGFFEGDENVVQMLLAGRKRTLADLNQLIPALEKSTARPDVLRLAANLRSADMAEAAKLDDLITVPGVKHQYFMTAVPTWLLRDQDPRPAIYRHWQAELLASKPAL